MYAYVWKVVVCGMHACVCLASNVVFKGLIDDLLKHFVIYAKQVQVGGSSKIFFQKEYLVISQAFVV
jgi:hypothetical protein